MEPTGPPLKIALCFFSIFIVFQIFVYAFVNFKVKKDGYRNDKALEQAFSDLKAADDQSLKVVVIGSSLVGLGVECMTNIYSESRDPDAPSVHLIKVWGTGDPLYQMVEDGKLLERIIEVRPDFVFFQTELLAVKFDDGLNYLRKSLNDLSFDNKIALNHFRQKFSSLDQYSPYGKQCVGKGTNKEIDTIGFEPIERKVKKIDDVEYLFDGLEALQTAGIKTVILDLPRPIAVEENFFDTQSREQLRKLIENYQQKFSMGYWKYTGPPMYFRHFIDGGHLSKNGRDIYTQWLLERIKQEKV